MKSLNNTPSKTTRPTQIPSKKLKELKAKAAKAFELWSKALPDPRCELYYETPFQLLISVVLSARATDKSVNKCMIPLYKQGFTIDTILALGSDGFLQKIRTIGLAPTKAKNAVALSKILKESHDGQVPNDRTFLESLPGVGRKTANVVLGELFQEPTLAVDTHVFRVGERLGLHHAKTPLNAEKELLKVFDTSFLPKAHHYMVLHGRYTCKSQRPLCQECVLTDLCDFDGKIQTAKRGSSSKKSSNG